MLAIPGVGDVCLASAPASAVPGDDGWLTPAEAAILGRFRFSKRAADWRLGRWVAKAVVADTLRTGSSGVGAGDAVDGPEAGDQRAPARIPDPQEIEILAGPGGVPRARILAPGAWPELSVSLSHAGGVGFAAAVVGARRLGCDVEEIAPRSEAFVSDYLTDAEAAWARAGGAEREVRANLLWSAKESALKALGEGLRKDTRTVVVDVEGLDGAGTRTEARRSARGHDGEMERPEGAWRPLCVTAPDGLELVGWWTADGARMWTVVGEAGERAAGFSPGG